MFIKSLPVFRPQLSDAACLNYFSELLPEWDASLLILQEGFQLLFSGFQSFWEDGLDLLWNGAGVLVFDVYFGHILFELEEGLLSLEELDVGYLDGIDEINQFKSILDEFVNIFISFISNIDRLYVVFKIIPKICEFSHPFVKPFLGLTQ